MADSTAAYTPPAQVSAGALGPPDPSPPGTWVADTIHDPDFAKLSEPEMYDVVIGVMEKHEPGFVDEDPKYKHFVAENLLNKYGVPTGFRGATPATGEIRKPIPGGVQLGEDVALPQTGMIGGAATGARIGGAVGGPTGAIIGAGVGAGTGAVASDLISAKINEKFFGRHPDLSGHHIIGQEVPNFVVSSLLESGGRWLLGRATRAFVGLTGLERGARSSQEEAAKMSEEFQLGQHERTSAGLGQIEKARQQVAEQEQAAQQQFKEQSARQATQAAKQALPQAQGQVIEQSVGRTAEDVAGARAQPGITHTPAGTGLEGPAGLPAEQTMQRQGRFHDMVFGPLYRAQKVLGQQYENLYGAVRKSVVPETEGLGNTVDDINKFATDNGFTYGKPTRDLLGDMKELSADADPYAAVKRHLIETGTSDEATVAGMSERQLQGFADMFKGSGVDLTTGGEGATVEKLLAKRSQALEITRSSAKGRDKAAAFQMVDSIDDTLENSGLVDQKRLAQINRTYGSYRKTFDTPFRRRIGGSFEPTNDAGEIFNEPQRFQQLWAGADDSEKANMRESYGEWLLHDGVDKAVGTIKKDDQRVILGQMFKGTPLADPDHWVFLDQQMATEANQMNSSPALKDQYETQLRTRIGEIADQKDREAVDWAVREAPKLGPYGEALAKKVRTMTPRDGAAEVVRFFRVHPDEAPIQALQMGVTQPGPFGKSMMGRAARSLTWYPELLAATAMMGHPSPYAAASMGLGAIPAVHLALQGAIKWAVKSPENAERLWNIMNNPNAAARTKALATVVGDALMSEVTTEATSLYGSRLAEQDRDEQQDAAP